MTHRHEWRCYRRIWSYEIGFRCTDKSCDAVIPWAEAERRLNATECLSAEGAKNAQYTIAESGNEYMLPVHEALKAYAEALSE